MPELEDFDLEPQPEEPQISRPPEGRIFGVAVVTILVVLGAGVAGYLVYRARLAPPSSTPVPATVAAALRATPIPEPEAVGLPALGQSDDFVRELAKGLSAHEQLRLWLGQQELVRLFVNVVETVGKGESPRPSLGFLAPKGAFTTTQRRGELVIEEKSYTRYDDFAQAVASLDVSASAEVFRRALPLLEAAYRELGYPEGGFERALRSAVTHLLAVPVVDGGIAVKPARRGNVLVYEYLDPALEALSPAQKHLLRMGPANVRRVQGTLRGFVSALGP